MINLDMHSIPSERPDKNHPDGEIACIGVGTIGSSWASLFAWKGYEVNIYDQSKEAVKKAKILIKTHISSLNKSVSRRSENTEDVLDRIHIKSDLKAALDSVWYVQESVFESYEVKNPLFHKMDKITPPETILATSTSGLLITEIQKAVNHHPERCIIAHPWNPPHIMPLIEVIPGPETSAETVDRTIELMDKLDKKPVLIKKDIPGQIGNRLSAALWREAVDLVTKGIATPEEIDTVLKYGPGLRWAIMGLFLTYHLGGGTGGMEYFLKKGFGATFPEWWKDMAKWDEYPLESFERIIEKIKTYSTLNKMDYRALSQWRDRKLREILRIIENTDE